MLAKLEYLAKDFVTLRFGARETMSGFSGRKMVPKEFRESLRARGEPATTILWILQGQALLLAGMGYSYTSESFGFPVSAEAEAEAGPRQVFAGQLPSIKMTKETVLKNTSNYAGSPTMHEVPTSPTPQ